MANFKLTSLRDNSIIGKPQDTLEMFAPAFGVSMIWIESPGDSTWACFPLDADQLRALSTAALEAADELENE